MGQSQPLSSGSSLSGNRRGGTGRFVEGSMAAASPYSALMRIRNTAPSSWTAPTLDVQFCERCTGWSLAVLAPGPAPSCIAMCCGSGDTQTSVSSGLLSERPRSTFQTSGQLQTPLPLQPANMTESSAGLLSIWSHVRARSKVGFGEPHRAPGTSLLCQFLLCTHLGPALTTWCHTGTFPWPLWMACR